MSVITNLPYELDIPVYDVMMFRWIPETDSFEVCLKIMKDIHHFPFNMNGLDSCLFASKMRKGVKDKDERYTIVNLHLPHHPCEPEDAYHSPSPLYYMGPNGIEWASQSMRKFKGLPPQARMCYQCEYDEYIWRKVESAELPKNRNTFYHWAVWNAFVNHRMNEEDSSDTETEPLTDEE